MSRKLYVANAEQDKIFTSTDDGANFDAGVSVASGYLNSVIRLINGDILCADEDSKIFRSTNNGASYTQVATLTGVWSFCQLANGDVLCLSKGQKKIFKSTNGGVDWTEISDISSMTEPIMMATNPARTVIYLTDLNTNKIHKSTDGGVNWDAGVLVASGGNIRGVAVASNGTTVYTVGWWYNKVYKSTDSGATWDAGTALGTSGATGLAVDWSTDYLYVTQLEFTRIRKSTNGGSTWVDADETGGASPNLGIWAYYYDTSIGASVAGASSSCAATIQPSPALSLPDVNASSSATAILDSSTAINATCSATSTTASNINTGSSGMVGAGSANSSTSAVLSSSCVLGAALCAAIFNLYIHEIYEFPAINGSSESSGTLVLNGDSSLSLQGGSESGGEFTLSHIDDNSNLSMLGEDSYASGSLLIFNPIMPNLLSGVVSNGAIITNADIVNTEINGGGVSNGTIILYYPYRRIVGTLDARCNVLCELDVILKGYDDE